MRRALAASVALHLGLASLWLTGLTGLGRAPDDVPLVEVELIQQAPAQQGAPSSGTPAASPAPEAPSDTGDAPRPAPSQAVQPTSASAPAVNLGNGPRDLDPLSVTGENVIPPAPDSAFRNRPPAYPAAAMRIRAEGIVQLLVRVSEAGVPAEVVVATSSGYASLDRAARDAVLLWHFRPARSGGAPVPFDYVMNIRFSMGDQ